MGLIVPVSLPQALEHVLVAEQRERVALQVGHVDESAADQSLRVVVDDEAAHVRLEESVGLRRAGLEPLGLGWGLGLGLG